MLALLAYLVLLFAVMPALLLGVGKFVAVYTSRRPKLFGFPEAAAPAERALESPEPADGRSRGE